MTPPLPRAPRPPAAAQDESTPLRERILFHATQRFASRGYSGTSLREVAEAAGCTKPALYYHFGSKEGLFLAAVRAEVDALTALLEQALRAPGTVRSRLCRLLEATLTHVAEQPVALALLERVWWAADAAQPHFDLVAVQDLHTELAKSLLAEGVRNGELRADVALDDAVLVLVGALHQRTELFLHRGVPIPGDAAERLIDLLFRGLAP